MPDVSCEPCYPKCSVTPMAAQAGIDLGWVQRQVDHVVNLLVTQGAAAKQTVTDILTTIKFFTNKQFLQAFAMLSQDLTDIEGLIAAIKAEFNS